MATGFSRSIDVGHDMNYDYCCTTCARQNLNAEALFYCKDCKKLLCDECYKHHAKFFEGHRVLGRKEVAEWGDVKPVTLSLMCDDHPEKELEMYCRDHGVVRCHICISVEHRSCKEVKPVSEVFKGIQKKSEFKTFLSEAATTQSRLQTVYNKQEDTIKMLQKARGEITSTFKNMRKKLNQMVDKLEDDSITELDRLLTMLKEQVKKDQDACSYFTNKIQKFLDDIQTLGIQCDELAFQSYKKFSEQMASADKLLFSLTNVDFQIKFILDSKIERLEQKLSSLETLGSLLVIPDGPLDSFKYKDIALFLTPPDHVYSVVKMQTYNVKTSGDNTYCKITGICQLPDQQTAIVDWNNSKVKLLSASTYSVLHELKLPSEPRDICHTTEKELAVTVCQGQVTYFQSLSGNTRKEIQFINARNGKLSHTRTVQLDHNCFGIAYHSGQLYVGSWNALFVYKQSGEKVKKIHEYISNSTVHPTVKRCCLSNDGSRIYVTNPGENLLIVLDSTGKLLSTFSDPKLLHPEGVCVADNGSVFVCGLLDTTLQVDCDGRRKMTTLVTKEDGINYPQSLCYDRKTHTLLVGQRGSNDLMALQLK